MKLTIRHRFNFDGRVIDAELADPESWDALRAGETSFGLPATRAEWERAAASFGLAPRAAAIAAVAHELGAGRVCSYGVGVAYLERNLLLAAPELELTCTDFAPHAVERLRGLFPEVVVVHHDLRTDPPLDSDLHLFHRLDTNFSDDEWPEVFAHFRVPVLFVATELLGLRNVARELLTVVRHPRATNAGWIRSEDALRALWRASHDDRRVELHDLPGYLLTPR